MYLGSITPSSGTHHTHLILEINRWQRESLVIQAAFSTENKTNKPHMSVQEVALKSLECYLCHSNTRVFIHCVKEQYVFSSFIECNQITAAFVLVANHTTLGN